MSPGKTDDFIAAGFTTQSEEGWGGEGGERAQVSETAMLAFSIVFPESSDKDGLYCHVAEYYSAVRVVKSLRHYTRNFSNGNIAFHNGIQQSRRCRVQPFFPLSLSLSFLFFFVLLKRSENAAGIRDTSDAFRACMSD